MAAARLARAPALGGGALLRTPPQRVGSLWWLSHTQARPTQYPGRRRRFITARMRISVLVALYNSA